uniref:Hsd17b8 protein n=1 Tax=Rattus norvegicus TaxID=10116 RepID=Q5BJM1_RAT|nr:Hsd17b8 protein [Rattus norvegicus]
MTSDLGPFPPTADSPISGAGSGIGRAISVRLAAEGAAVAACDLDGAAAQDTVRLLGNPGSEDREPRGKHAAFQADVSEGPAAKRLLEQVQVNRAPRRTPPQLGPLWSLALASSSLP